MPKRERFFADSLRPTVVGRISSKVTEARAKRHRFTKNSHRKLFVRLASGGIEYRPRDGASFARPLDRKRWRNGTFHRLTTKCDAKAMWRLTVGAAATTWPLEVTYCRANIGQL